MKFCSDGSGKQFPSVFSFVLTFLQSESGCRFLGYYYIGKISSLRIHELESVPCQHIVQTLSQHTTQPAGELLENTCCLFSSLSPHFFTLNRPQLFSLSVSMKLHETVTVRVATHQSGTCWCHTEAQQPSLCPIFPLNEDFLPLEHFSYI